MLEVQFTPFPVLQTERLLLKQITVKDAERMFAMRSNKTVMQYIDRPPTLTIEDALQLIQKIENGLTANEGITWGIYEQNSDILIGSIGFWRLDKANHRAEIGYMIDIPFQGKGFMQEALTAVLDYGFTIMRLHSVEANVNPLNDASKKILERNNFVPEAYFRENYYFNGKFLDSLIYSLLTSLRG